MTRFAVARPLPAQPVIAALAAAAGCAYLVANSPYEPASALPACPTKLLTGLDCPLCGGLRMTYSLLHGDVTAALRANALLLVLLPVAVAGWLLRLRRHRSGTATRAPVKRAAAIATLAVITGWTVLRNVL